MELSKSEKYLLRKGEALPTVTPNMAHVVSQYRREGLEEEMHDGKFSVEGSGGRHYSGSSGTPLGNVVSSSHVMKKYAASFTSDGGSSSGYRGSSDTYRQVPEVYSPLWLNSNLNLPRDRATINAWARSFFALNPIVQNAISLHATYPISKLNIKCKNPEVNAFFENMIDEIDLENICVQIAQEYWTLGEAFVYAELNESTATWSRLLIQNPDYITVKNSVIAGEPIISLRPDENLRRICTGNTASDIQQRQQLDRSIVEHVRKGRDIPLSNFYASHIARKIAPYEVRGTGLPVSCFRQLMLFDKLRECYSTDCEVLTTEGFKRIDEITEISTDTNPKSEYVNGVQLDENNNITGVLKLKDGIKVACFNKDTEELEYHVPEELHMSKYAGKMLHFNSSNMDVLVTPNHKMWASQRHGKEFGEYDLIRASEFDPKKVYKFRSVTNWTGKDVEFADVAGSINEVDYDDAVWCLTVPTGLFVTRRNNRITIQGNSKFSQADNMINPLTLVKIGGGADNYKPTPADLEQWRQIFEESQYDKDFKIFTHDGVNVERVGFGQGIYDISGDVTQLLKEIYIGLLVPQVIMDGGADVTYANGGVALDVLRQRYMQFRNTLSSWLRRKIFAPISKINDFYDIVDGEKVLIVPTVEWNHMSLFDMGDYIQNLSQLLSQEPRKVSVQTLYKSLGLEYEDEQRKIRRENIDQIIAAKEMEAMQRMSLNDLRSIGEEDEIQEITESPLPGEQALDPAQPGGLPGMPGGDLGMGGPGMGGGGLIPPMPPMGGGMGGPPPPMGGPPGGGGGGPPPPAGL